MAELNFPASPVDGQIYGNFIWSAATGAWLARPQPQSVAVSSPTAPTSPVVNTLWYNTNDGNTYIYNYDGDSYQWVQLKSDATLSSTLGSRVDALEVKSPNYIINGAFDIWQRGTSSSATGYQTADRWYCSGANCTFSQDASNVVPGTQYSLKATMSGAGGPTFYQAVETLNAVQMAGQTVTLSAYLASNVSVAGYLRVEYSTTADNALTGTWTSINSAAPNLTSALTRYTLTVSVPSTAKSVRVLVATSTNLAAGNTFTVGAVQLELGSTATPFRRNANSIQGELAACQRYFQSFGGFGSAKIGQGNMYNGTNGTAMVRLSPTMRTAPTFSYIGALSDFRLHVPGIYISNVSSISLDNSSNTFATLSVGAGSGATAGNAVVFQSETATAYVWFSAEL